MDEGRRTVFSVLGFLLAAMMIAPGCGSDRAGGPAAEITSSAAARLDAALDAEDFDGVRAALGAGAGANSTLPSGDRPLPKAVLLQNVSIVRLLLAAGADPNLARAADCPPPIALCVASNRRTLAETLLRAGADPNRRFGQGLAMTPLGSAAVTLNSAAIGALIQAGADPDAWNLEPISEYPGGYHPGRAEGRTALMMAAAAGNYVAVLVLLDRGADPSLRNERGQRAVDLIDNPGMRLLRDALAHPERFAPHRKR